MYKPSQTISDTKLDTTFREPLSRFDLNPPSYAEICKVITRMKSKGSPCPFGSDLNHMLQKMPVSTHVHHRNLCKSLRNKSYSVIMEESSQYINLQKGFHRQSSELPTNYLEPVALKIFTSSLRNKICAFLCQNNLSLIYRKDLFTMCQVHSSTQHI